MKKLFSFFILLFVLSFAISLINCGSDTTRPQAVQFAYLTQAPSGSEGPYQPVIGTLVGDKFTATPVKESSGKDITGWFGSVVLSKDGKKGAADIEGVDSEDIVVGLVDGSKAINITEDSEYDSDPALSPDGKKVFFLSDRGTASMWDTMMANTDGSGLTNLTADSPTCHHEPSMSPDSKNIVFTGHGHTSPYIYDVYVMGADGKNPVNLTKGTDNAIFAFHPSYSPDGKQIVYARLDNSGSSGVWDIYVMNADGTGAKALTTSGHATMARFLSDGTITFMSDQEGNYEIYRMKADGSKVTRLTSNSVYDGFAVDWDREGPVSRNAVRHHMH